MTHSVDAQLPSRFFALDAIRGIAAIAVVFYHYTQHNALDWLHGAWVAVDIFFILSGFVLMHSYGKKVTQGMTFKEFTWSRIARLGPMYAIGLSLGITAALFSLLSNVASPISLQSLSFAAALNAFLLPYFNQSAWPFGEHIIHGTVFPLNDPAWSLFFEMFVNIIFFLYLYRFQKLNLWISVAVAGVVFVATTLAFHQINPGARGDSFVFGFPRVLFEFFLGVLIYKNYPRLKSPSLLAAWIIATLVIIACCSRLGAVGLLNGLLLAPVLIVAFAKFEVTTPGAAACRYLGDISYPLYVTHFPLYRLFYEMKLMNGLSPAVQTLAFAGLSILIATGLVKLDKMVRAALKAERLTRLQNI